MGAVAICMERESMLNEERIILMTKLASYEQGKGRKNIRISKYFRSDYLILQILKTLFYTTIAYAILIGLYLLYHLETLTENLYQMDLIGFVQKILMLYGVLMVVCCVITYIVYSYRYLKARKSQKEFMNNLKKLNAQQ